MPNGVHRPISEPGARPDAWSQPGAEAPAEEAVLESRQRPTHVANDHDHDDDHDQDVDATDDVVMAVRRAVASIETGSLAARRRLVEQPVGDATLGQRTAPQPNLPGRLAARSESGMPSGGLAVRVMRPVSGSVFDDVPITGAKRAIDVPLESR